MTDDGDSRFDRALPAFALHAGQPWQTMIDRLVALNALRWRVEADGTVHCQFPQMDETSWTYTGQEFAGAWQQRNGINHVLVQGKGVLGEAWDWDAVRTHGSEQTVLVTDTQLTQAADCQGRAEAVLAGVRRDSNAYAVDVPYNPTLQIGDMVDFQRRGLPTASCALRGSATASHRTTRTTRWFCSVGTWVRLKRLASLHAIPVRGLVLAKLTGIPTPNKVDRS